MLIAISQSQKWHFQIAHLVRPTVQTSETVYLLAQMTRKSNKIFPTL